MPWMFAGELLVAVQSFPRVISCSLYGRESNVPHTPSLTLSRVYILIVAQHLFMLTILYTRMHLVAALDFHVTPLVQHHQNELPISFVVSHPASVGTDVCLFCWQLSARAAVLHSSEVQHCLDGVHIQIWRARSPTNIQGVCVQRVPWCCKQVVARRSTMKV